MKNKIKKYCRLFISSICAGFSIGLGGLIFLSVDSKVIGSIL